MLSIKKRAANPASAMIPRAILQGPSRTRATNPKREDATRRFPLRETRCDVMILSCFIDSSPSN
jgi:hypothetical protein